MFKKGLRPYFMFREMLGLEGVYNLSDFLNRDQPYTNYEEELLVENGERR